MIQASRWFAFIPLLLAAGCGTPDFGKRQDPDLEFANVRGGDSFHRGRASDAVEYYQKAYSRARSLDATAEAGLASFNLAVCYLNLGRFAEAHEAAQTARDCSASLGQPHPETWVLEARAFNGEGKYEEALRITREQGADEKLPRSIRFSLGLAEVESLVRLDRKDEATEKIEWLGKHVRGLDDAWLEAEWSALAGENLLTAGESDAALKLFQRELLLRRTIPDLPGIAAALHRNARAYRALEKRTEALDAYLRCVASFFAQGEPEAGGKVATEGLAYAEEGGDSSGFKAQVERLRGEFAGVDNVQEVRTE